METQQIVVQLTNSPNVRAIVQYGDGFLPDSQSIINYDDLTDDQKVVWNEFINMITPK